MNFLKVFALAFQQSNFLEVHLKERFMLEQVFGNVFVSMYSTFLKFHDQISRQKIFPREIWSQKFKKGCILKQKHCIKLVLA